MFTTLRAAMALRVELIVFLVALAFLPMQLWAQAANLTPPRRSACVIYGTIIPQVMSQIEKGFEASTASRPNIARDAPRSSIVC